MVDVFALDSATHLHDEHRDKVLVIGSQGTIGPSLWAAQAGVRAVILNDAGVGKDNAGISGLGYLQDWGLPAACIAATSARISDGEDMLRRGVISHVNNLAARLGVTAGQTCAAAAEALTTAAPYTGTPDASDQPQRHLLTEKNGVKVWGLDTMPLMTEDDAGHIIVTGSHGGLVGGDPKSANRGIALRAAIYHDAGIGPDDSSTSRLPALDGFEIIGATVSAETARISDARSCYEDGSLSLVNDRARAAGGSPGMPAREFVSKILNGTP